MKEEEMNEELDRIREEILEDQEFFGDVDAEIWLAAHPEYAEEIRSFIRTLGYDPDVPNTQVPDSLWRNAARRHLLSGPHAIGAWAENVGALIAEARAEAQTTAPQATGDAVETSANAYTWALGVAKQATTAVTRLVIHKVLYFVEEAFKPNLVPAFSPGARGPFSPGLYRGEDRAKAKGWVVVTGDPQVDFGPGASPALAAESLVGRLPLRAAEALADFLSALSHEELEVLATVQWAAKKAINGGHAVVGVPETRAAIAQVPEWEYKTRTPAFSDSGIRQALVRLTELQLLPRERVRLE
ncbi:MAG TPA: hypothetical protein VF006_18155 [Longimicrobium sp.]